MKKLDQQYSPPTYNVSTIGYNNSDESLVLDYVPVSEDGFQNFGQMENNKNLSSSIQYIPAMNSYDPTNFTNTPEEQANSPTAGSDKPLRFRRQPKTKSDQPVVDNFSKQSHMFFVPSAGSSPSSSTHQAQEDNLNVSLGYSVPEFIPTIGTPHNVDSVVPPLHHLSTSYQSDFSTLHNNNNGMMNSTISNHSGFVQHHHESNSFQAYPSYQDQQKNIPSQKEFKPVFIKPKQSICSGLLKYLIVLIFLIVLGVLVYGGYKLWSESKSSNPTVSQNFISKHTTHQEQGKSLNIDNVVENEEEVIVDKEESKPVNPTNPPIISEVSSGESNTKSPNQPKENEPTLTNSEITQEEQKNQEDPYHFYDPFQEVKTKKPIPPKPKKKKQTKPKKKVKIPQEIYDRVYPKKKKSNEAKFDFMDEKIEKYLDNLSEKEYNKLSNTNKELIKKYIHLREKESFEKNAKSSSGKYKKKGIRKKKVKTNPYEFDYAKNDDDEMQIASDPSLPVKTVRDKKGKIHHVDPFGENEHENNEAYDEDVKNYMNNPDYEKYINKYDQDDEDDSEY